MRIGTTRAGKGKIHNLMLTLPGDVRPGDYVHIAVTQLRPMSTASTSVGIVTLELVDDYNDNEVEG